MITLTKSTHNEGLLATKKTTNEPVETAGSLAMLFENGLLTVGQYDEFIASNPFNVDYSQYFECSDFVADSGFLSNFANAVSTLNDCSGFSCAGFSCDCSSCGSFSSVC